jgi:hypothetical protein
MDRWMGGVVDDSGHEESLLCVWYLAAAATAGSVWFSNEFRFNSRFGFRFNRGDEIPHGKVME